MYTFLIADLTTTGITYKNIVDSRKEAATKEDRVATIDIITTKIIATSIAISSKIRSIRFIIRLAIGQ
jgi:hypothetical protein